MTKESWGAGVWEPTRWWRAIGPDGVVWCESSVEEEVRDAARPIDRIERLWTTVPTEEWRVVRYQIS